MNVDIQGIGMTSQRTRDRLIRRLEEHGIRNPDVLAVMRDTPRHLFVDEALASRAYEDTALPIGFRQTISQPYIVARMTELLLEDGIPDTVLEVGTGSGYQAAVLAPLVRQLYSVERNADLLRQAEQRFRQLKLHNIATRHADGHLGWPEKSPFDGIIVTAAPATLPEELLRQLGEGGRLVVPVGGAGSQDLIRVTRRGDQFEQETLDKVVFVPLVQGKT
ncbi:MAG TPA: protein-L-isoaspartate(D-aspartate) O-methyltransferase [Gammaproteobacteria bacterium]|nr:protein-L-isoaspartate(D-aspartate) O-methyltransferase [Gammaproteobacteria bacterium]